MGRPRSDMREKLYEVIFGIDTPAGRAFDVVLLWMIVLSVMGVLLESVSSLRSGYGALLKGVEWGFTILFTVEYALRIYSSRSPGRYSLSFFGIADLLAILPTYLGLVFAGAHSLLILRALRLLRIFRILKLARFIRELDVLIAAFRAVRVRIFVFICTVLTLVMVIGAAMYLIEGERHGFTSIPRAMYWAVVTMTTVGYGDIAPQTTLGQFLSSIVMLLGYGIIVVPAGIFSAEMVLTGREQAGANMCGTCLGKDHEEDARYCRSCGRKL